MSAKVSTRFERRFELNEENIRRIHSDIRKRTPNENHEDIIFEVFREDSLVFRTAEVDRVLSENNDSTQKIKELNIEYNDDSLSILLEFDSENGAELTINGEDRDQVFLISSDLKEYIQKEVCHIKAGITDKRLLMIPVVLLVFFMFFIVRTMAPPSNTIDVEQILSSNDISLKLNHLITLATERNKTDQKGWTVSIAPLILCLFFLIPGQKAFNYFFPGNIFMLGKQITVVSNRRNLVRNIFWCGVVGLVIAFISGYYFLWVSK